MRTDLSLPCALPSLLFIFHLQTLITRCSPFSLSTPPITHCFDHHSTAHHHHIPHLSSSLHNLHLPLSLALFLSRTPSAFDPSTPDTLPTSPTPTVSSLLQPCIIYILYIYIYISCMDSWESSLRPSRHRPITGNSRTTHHPSFSSSLLDAIYRSIDEGEDSAIGGATKEEEELAMYKEKLAARRPAAAEKLVRGFADYDSFHRRRTPSASSSSGSSYGGLSSSESESACYRARPAADKGPPAKTFMAPFDHRRDEKALRKEKKHQVSPGARIAGFLNSLLGSAKTAKKAKLSSAPPIAADSRSPTPSSTSSRSCLSKSGGGGGSGKRSVRFYPVSVIVDEDCRPCGQKSLHDPWPATTRYLSEELKVHIMENNKRVEAAADRILNRHQTRTEILLRRESWAVPPAAAEAVLEEEDEDDCDAASYASSDLFELENLGVIGGERYREELPVYETTNVVTNRAIAHGLIL